MEYRIEHDTMGKVKVPADRYWGAQTERSRNNFKIDTDTLMPLEIIYAYAAIKKAAALANRNLGLLPSDKASLIVSVCDEIAAGQHDQEFPLVVWQTGSGTQTNMNLNEVIANRAEVILGQSLGDGDTYLDPNDDVNRSQSSNDTFPTAVHIATARLTRDSTIPGIKQLYSDCEDKVKTLGEIIKIGRTHLMDATPVSFGQEFSAYVHQLKCGEKAITNSLQQIYEITLGGTAVGTGLNCPNGFAEMALDYLTTDTGLPLQLASNRFEAQSACDAIVDLSGAFKRVAVSVTKIANDLRLAGSGPRCGLGELNLPANEPGSSIMPGKVNPTQCEALTMAAAQVVGNDVAISIGGAGGQFQLNAYQPLIARNILHSARLLGDACESFAKNCLAGIEVNVEQVNFNLEQSLMLVTALAPQIGYKKAAEIAKYAFANKTTLKDAASTLRILDTVEFDRIVNPREMI